MTKREAIALLKLVAGRGKADTYGFESLWKVIHAIEEGLEDRRELPSIVEWEENGRSW